MSARKILVVEDDPAIGQGLVDALLFGGHEPRLVTDGKSGLQSALEYSFDLILLDLALPKMDGLKVLTELKEVRPMQAVIILTARGSEPDRIRGLQLGADDYVVKPFSLQELLARVDAVLRRVPPQSNAPTAISIGECRVDFASRQVEHFGERTSLSQKEAELLEYLAHHQQRAVSREELLQNVWGLAPQGTSTRTIDMHVARLREKLHDTPGDPQLLKTIHGCGYRLMLDNVSQEAVGTNSDQALQNTKRSP